MVDIIKRNNVQLHGTKGPVIVYAHGFGCNQEMWSGIVPSFSSSCRQITFDYVGSGGSDFSSWEKDRYSQLDGYVQDIIEICDALELTENINIVGHSVSASIAILAGIKRPALFNKLVLIGPTPCFLNDPPIYTGGFDREDLIGLLELMDHNYMGWANYLAPIVSGETENATTTTSLHDSFCSTDPIAAKAFAKATFFADNREDLKHVKTPSLIIQHLNDTLVPVGVGNFLHDNLNNSELLVLDVAGHCAHMSHPDLIVAAMRSYLNTDQ
jgi:sigma-B regulation protein RsbQ